MTDTEFKIEEEPAPELIATHYLTGIDELVEHLRAADQLGLGVRVSSYLVGEEEGTRWELDLLTSSPVHQDEEPAAAPEDEAISPPL